MSPDHAAGCRTRVARATRPRSTDSDSGGDLYAWGRSKALRDSAHLYLDYGLLPVPAWGVTAAGACRCPRGAVCARPGKHPRSVRTGPGRGGYSWKPLTCATREEVDHRFADGGAYAAANLMLAIPAGMMVIDQDNDDGGRQALAALAEQLGAMPPTLTHQTPHGAHFVYRTPPGWTGRAWVGKDASNPLPTGIDLRMPGQILMAQPSLVPGGTGLASYGPVTGHRIANLPGTYLAAWTPASVPVPRRPVPVQPDRADVAASYVQARIGGILADLADHEPGGRNAAIYTAALKVGSTIGAARTTPGAGHAAACWTDEAAEDALMAAAEQNGYVSHHGITTARTTVRSGLRNGLRSPRPLPDFSAQPAAGERARRWRESAREQQADREVQASRAAAAANAAYRSGEYDLARELTDQAAAIDPSRSALWRQHRAEIDAKSLFGQARAAEMAGDPGRAQELLDEARQLDARMQMLWSRNLSAVSGPGQRSPGADIARSAGYPVHPPGRPENAGPQWPDRPALCETTGSRMPRVVEPRAADAATAGSNGARQASAADWRDAVLQRERRAWQPTVTQPPDALGPAADTRGPEATG